MSGRLKKGPQTQRSLLDAARKVFTESGFSEARVADIVNQAGSSVGSLYHHFGSKSGLFLALWQEHQLAYEEAASRAMADAKENGMTDPGQLLATGTRAFLRGTWQRRDLAPMFASGDAPPGFEVTKQLRSSEWIGQTSLRPQLDDTPTERVYTALLASLIGEGAYQVATARSRRQADRIIDAVAEYASRLVADGQPHQLRKTR